MLSYGACVSHGIYGRIDGADDPACIVVDRHTAFELPGKDALDHDRSKPRARG